MAVHRIANDEERREPRPRGPTRHQRLNKAMERIRIAGEKAATIVANKFDLSEADLKEIRALSHEIDAACETYMEVNR
jgi:hypothetical protein